MSLILSLFLGSILLFRLRWRVVSLVGKEVVLEWEARIINSTRICFLLVFDWVSLFFISVVSLISARVIFYSSSYISADRIYSRFIFLVLSFILRIWLLILRPNFISILLGWDGLGVTSYLLVIYYQREKSFNAGIITALTNRLGDAGLLVFIGLMLQAGSWRFFFSRFGSRIEYTGPIFLVILVAITKRAQIPFSSWLPAAMAAPTPVSSLVHSSTLVTAGVYLLIRLNYMLIRIEFMWGLCLLGAVTIIMAGGAAIFEVDIKKIIALSTLSQLGLMFITLGMGLPLMAFFHLIAHAYFKAILFISAGGIIHRIKEFQDLRAMGAAVFYIPVSVRIFLVANLSLCGIPFMSGFFSKDLILELLIIRSARVSIFAVAIISTGLTVLYSFRIFFLIFFYKPLSEPGLNLVELDNTILIGAGVLLFPSIIGGIFISWLSSAHNYLIFLPIWIKLFILLIIILTASGSRLMGGLTKKKFFFSFIHFMWFMPALFRYTSSKIILTTRKKYFSRVDSGWSIFISTGYLKKINKVFSRYIFWGFKRRFLKRLIFLVVTLVFV